MREIVYKKGGANAYKMEIPLGHVPGQSSVNKFGANTDIANDTTEDVWDIGDTYTFPANDTAPITHIHSTSAADTEPIEIQGLDVNGVLAVQTITLTGTTLVALTTPLWRVFRLKNVGVANMVGSIHVTNAGDTVTYAQIQIGNNQTLMAIYTVPLGKIALLTKYYCTTVDAANKTLHNGVFQIKHAVGIPQSGSMVEHEFNPYPKINELVDIKINALPLDEAADVAAGFDLILIDA